MKLGYLTNQYPRVSHTFIRREIQSLEREGFDIARFSIRPSAEPLPDPDDQREAERTEYVLGRETQALSLHLVQTARRDPDAFSRALRLTWKLGWRSQRGLVRHFAYLAEACSLRSRCAARGISHLHVHHATNPAAVALLCRALGGPSYSLMVHGPEEFEHAPSLALSLKVSHAAFVATPSEWSCRQLMHWCTLEDHAKVHVLRIGLPDIPGNDGACAVPDVRHLVWVGRLVDQKDPLTLVNAIERLRAQKVMCTITLVGDGPLRPRLEGQIARSGLGDMIALAGWASSAGVLAYLRNARALVVSSRAENVPVVIVEALALGRPVVSTDVGGIRELVQQGATGWLVPPESPNALADAIRRVLETDVQQLTRMARAGRESILAKYSVEGVAHQLRALFTMYCA